MKKGLSAVSHVYYQQPGQVENFDNATTQVLVMGTPVTSQNQVPLIQTITHMHKHVLLEGLFRKPGSKLRIDQMVIELERSGFSEVVANMSYTGHDYASLLKQFLSELPEPLLIKRHINAYIQASGELLICMRRYLELLYNVGIFMLCFLNRASVNFIKGSVHSTSNVTPPSVPPHSFAAFARLIFTSYL